MQVNLANDNLA